MVSEYPVKLSPASSSCQAKLGRPPRLSGQASLVTPWVAPEKSAMIPLEDGDPMAIPGASKKNALTRS